MSDDDLRRDLALAEETADDYAREARELRVKVKALETALQAQVDAGPLCHGGGSAPHALTYVGRKWVPLSKLQAARAEVASLREALISCESPHFCPSCDAKLGPQDHKPDCLLRAALNAASATAAAFVARVREEALGEACEELRFSGCMCWHRIRALSTTKPVSVGIPDRMSQEERRMARERLSPTPRLPDEPEEG